MKYKVTLFNKRNYRRETKRFDTPEEREKYIKSVTTTSWLSKKYKVSKIFDEEEKEPEIITTTCQICGRAIKAKNGVIAHHGYTRPYAMHYQTSSCDGARFLPYEESRDRIPQVIERLQKAVENNKNTIEAIKNKKIKLHCLETKRVDGKIKNQFIIIEPIDINYEAVAKNEIAGIERDIRYLESDIKHLSKRFDDWKAPENK